ncbi:molecular chaperone [Desulfopila sp. IMCC35008]|uniref:TorD/DmsD family molecular chaperone n=1 Tax=Desulfopila sp. IMCC35008 TaxID=2653858 RepID=UPI0013D5FA4E|nr:molecular chaperone TorD family protein [Desulfopila sp. IMCC35008]
MKEIEETVQRGDCFKLLAACFYEPDKQLFLEEELTEKLEHLLQRQSPDGVAAAREMQSSLKTLGQEKLSVDHAVLFVGPFELTAAPYGSVYIEKKRTVMGGSTINVARLYQDAGVSVDIKEPPDHIAIELEFMYYLCAKEAASAREGKDEESCLFREKQKAFFFNALMPWAVDFCEAIRQGTDNGFYIHLSACLEQFLRSCKQLYSKEYEGNLV